jgi:hypothetical protein
VTATVRVDGRERGLRVSDLTGDPLHAHRIQASGVEDDTGRVASSGIGGEGSQAQDVGHGVSVAR